MNLWRWSKWLPNVTPDKRLDLGTGSTPLVRSRQIGPASSFRCLFHHCDLLN